jgi:hypothetical protein
MGADVDRWAQPVDRPSALSSRYSDGLTKTAMGC